MLGGPLVAIVSSGQGGWLIPLMVVAISTYLIVRPEEVEPADDVVMGLSSTSSGSSLMDAQEPELEYVRTRTPAVPLTKADGTVINLRSLAAEKPVLLLAVSEGCGACLSIIRSVKDYRALLPEVDIRLLIRALPEHSTLTDVVAPQTLHDPHGYVSGSISDWPTPAAVLLGMDGLLAGGPEIGNIAIPAFISDIYENLHGVRPPTATPTR
ncbi:hypothetical protein [Gulosibacter molinativorax]|uniref:hypothetical protein n=1 Tax=Gulosibacter molinativorax TaxID=256821 RepID=UPI001FE0B564|nr:hypothetical protein [Gulosibacter molinativorax]